MFRIVSATMILAVPGISQPLKTDARFDVASIRLHDPTKPKATMRFLPSGEIWIGGMTVKNLILLVYNLKDDQVLGGPKWLDTDLYDIRAKSAPPTHTHLMDEQKGRLRSLLTDSFQLRAHHEERSEPVYYLNVAKGGLKLRPANDGATHGKGSILPWTLLVRDIGRRADRPLIDNVRLQGAYSVELKYTTDEGTPSGIGVRGEDLTGASGPSFFAALEQQLGLRLDPGKGRVERLVIDFASRPPGN